MQIVSGPVGRDVARYEALPSAQVVAHMDRFLAWFERTRPTGGAIAAATVNGIARAALVHLWFESIHLVEDGNGRPGRALADMALAQNLHAQDPQASQAVVRDATDKAQCRWRAAQSQTNERQRKVLARLLEAGHVGSGGGFV